MSHHIFIIFHKILMTSIFKSFKEPFRNPSFFRKLGGLFAVHPQDCPSLASIVHGLWKTAADAGAVEAAVRDMAKEPENSKDPGMRWTWYHLLLVDLVVFFGPGWDFDNKQLGRFNGTTHIYIYICMIVVMRF